MSDNHPATTVDALRLWEKVVLALDAADQLQKEYPSVADYRLTGATASLREALRLTRELADGTTKELDAVRAQIANDPQHPLYNPEVFTAQVRRGTLPWKTTGTKADAKEAAELLGIVMQENGLRYSELYGKHGHFQDLIDGHVLTADNGVSFRVVRPGEDTAGE
jgi:hypothetical protein